MDLELRPTEDPLRPGTGGASLPRSPSIWLVGNSFITALALVASALTVSAGRGASVDAFWGLAVAFALLVASGGAVLVLGLTVAPPFRWKGGRPNTVLPLVGVAAACAVQAGDAVVAVMLGGADRSAYVAAASLSRIVLLVSLPVAGWALASASEVRRRRVVVAAGVSGVVFLALELAPEWLSSLVFQGRPGLAGGPIRPLTAAALLSTIALIEAGVLGASGRLPWSWTAVAVAAAGLVTMTAVGGSGHDLALVALVVQAALVAALAAHAIRIRPLQRTNGVLILNWRDTKNPEGGGSEVFVEEVAARLAASGRPVTIFCAAYDHAPRGEVVRGVRVLRRGSSRTVYPWALLYHLTGRFGPHGVTVDVQNGIPFFTTLYCHKPVVVLVHHVHREQWGIVFKPRMARFGWWVESRLAPRIYRGARYVAVSSSTREELTELGVDPAGVTVVRNGTDCPDQPETSKTSFPSICVLGRLVPHKRVEIVLRAAATLRAEIPALQVFVVGAGYWGGHLRAQARHLGIGDAVHFLGHVDEETKGRALSASWLMAMPSMKEGWGLAVLEAAARGTPSVGFETAGGLTESIVHGTTGLLGSTEHEFVASMRSLLTDPDLRAAMGDAARLRARGFRWEQTAARFEAVLTGAMEEAAERRWLSWGSRGRSPASVGFEEAVEAGVRPQVP